MSAEHLNQPARYENAPQENFSKGLAEVNLPSEFGEREQGKVRDIWIKDGRRIMVATDRKSAYDKPICTVPGSGAALNLTSEYWFNATREIVPNHMIDVPHANVMIAKQATAVIPVEIVWRKYMEKSQTSTSLYYNYFELGRRNIYGIGFPNKIKPNQELPMGMVLTPTTKGEKDLEMTEEEAGELVDRDFGKGTWKKVRTKTSKLFSYGSESLRRKGLILASSKYEMGIDENGELMLIDELHTSDSSRIWKMDSYGKKIENGEDPDNFDKEILRRFLADNGFTGKGSVPFIPQSVKSRLLDAYEIPFMMLRGMKLPAPADVIEVRRAIINYFSDKP